MHNDTDGGDGDASPDDRRYLDLCPSPRMAPDSTLEFAVDQSTVRYWHARYPNELVWIEFIHQLAVRAVRASNQFDEDIERLLPVRLEDFTIPKIFPQGRYLASVKQTGAFFRVTVTSVSHEAGSSVVAMACVGRVRMGVGA